MTRRGSWLAARGSGSRLARDSVLGAVGGVLGLGLERNVGRGRGGADRKKVPVSGVGVGKWRCFGGWSHAVKAKLTYLPHLFLFFGAFRGS
jgi:hypothetical protein